ncbi:hypothetical protein MKJ01_12510 [Chryseobacterium sp. SSA4.19]|uniref:hypothetical protein n=1 Tax=Chryseobacterium sp. SSA4.19 TaxID=2919915 RepID=UPI001F4E81B9|nr:hypothetical protein [Chryseobacterium sp. SSA4.19]MCJ8154586.1 hypothetical protein [Chryseobacterium sp. SSA4.19]
MLKQIFGVLSFLSIISCEGDFEEKRLLDYSEKNGKVKFEIIKRDFTKNDSLNFEEKRFVVFDSRNRIINKNNSQFFFYDHNNKLKEIKSIYRRGGKTNILIDKYLYDEKQNLIFITYQFNEVDTTQIIRYNKSNQLIQKDYPLRHLSIKYKYVKDKISEIRESENESISKNSKFIYDSIGNKLIEDWEFKENQRLRTYFKYNSRNKPIYKRDSALTNSGNPNEYVEFIDKYYYDKNDSLIEKRQYGRFLSEKEFKYRGKTTFEYKRIIRN